MKGRQPLQVNSSPAQPKSADAREKTARLFVRHFSWSSFFAHRLLRFPKQRIVIQSLTRDSGLLQQQVWTGFENRSVALFSLFKSHDSVFSSSFDSFSDFGLFSSSLLGVDSFPSFFFFGNILLPFCDFFFRCL